MRMMFMRLFSICCVAILVAPLLHPVVTLSSDPFQGPKKVSFSPAMEEKISQAKRLYSTHFQSTSGDADITSVAPGRVNLIGEHTDYTGGFVLPFAIDYSTIVHGSGKFQTNPGPLPESPSVISLTFLSSVSPQEVAEFELTLDTKPPKQTTWATYVCGTAFQYLNDLPLSSRLDLAFTIVGDVPLGSGLSSSASLEVAVARFVEEVLGDVAFSSEDVAASDVAKARALRCQRAENEWCRSPCGIMDQFISSAATEGSLLLIDCDSLDSYETKMAKSPEQPVLVVTNSNVRHDIAGGEYPVRVQQCKQATSALSKIDPDISSLRKATIGKLEQARELMDDVSYKRARHVVTENERTLKAKEALEMGKWERVGELMNMSHASMRDDYEVSCDEIDVLVDIAKRFDGVYGSRLTGGGFGGCTVSLVHPKRSAALINHLVSEYKARTGKDCFCFETKPSGGARVL